MQQRIIKDSIVFVAGLLVFVLIGLGWVARMQAQMLVNPLQQPATQTPAQVGIADFQPVRLTTADGLHLAAWYVPPPTDDPGGAIIYTHGISSRRDHWLTEMARLYEAGYGAILFDFRNHGESEGDITTMGVREVQDVAAALQFLSAQPEVDPTRIMLVGDSFGASTGLLAAAELPAIRGVVAVSPYSSLLGVVGDRAQTDFRLPPRPTADLVLWWAQRMSNENLYQADVVAAASQLPPRPVWLVHGELDPVTPPASTARLAGALREAGADNLQVWIVQGVGHSAMRHTHAAEFQQRLLAFVESVIGD